MFHSILEFCGEGREKHSIVSKLEGTLLISSSSSFPYFMLVAIEAGSPLRALLLLLISPLLWLLEVLKFGTIALRLTIFISLFGLRVADVKAVAKAVLPRFFLEDLCGSTFRVFSTCGGKKYVVTSIPTIFVEAFLRDFLDVDVVIGTEVRSHEGYFVGLVAKPFFMSAVIQLEDFRAALGNGNTINVGIGDFIGDPFLLLCQETYIVPQDKKEATLPRNEYPKPLIFHDGRLVARPTPSDLLAVFMWLPMGVFLAISRLFAGKVLPYKFDTMVGAAIGMKIRTKFPNSHTWEINTQSPRVTPPQIKGGVYQNTLYVCSHRTLIDPVIVAITLQQQVTAVTYGVSRITEMLSPIRTVPLSRDRSKDGETLRTLLKQGDLVVCPEGTTCREPYLLRFSPLFAEIADVVVPVAVSTKATMFHGTTVRGHKWLDSFFFLMNPNPYYQLEFLEKLSIARMCKKSGKSSFDIANYVQQMIGNALGFECTNFTRRDKYRILAGNDGVVVKN